MNYRANYPAHQLSQLKQQMGTRIINTSREPVSLDQLTGKSDGDPVSVSPFVTQNYTGVPIVDGAVQQASNAMGQVSHGVGNFVSTAIRGAALGGVGALTLSGGVMAVLKLLGHFKETSWGPLIGGSMVAGFVGSILGGLCGIAKASYNSIRDIKHTVLGN